MIDLPLIKYACGLADGFEYDESMEVVRSPAACTLGFYTHIFKREIYPLLLQSAIEGVNDRPITIAICQTYTGIEVYEGPCDIPEPFDFADYPSKTATKAAALRYVMEQEGA